MMGNETTIKRLSQEEERGRIKGGRILKEATLVAGRYTETSSTDQRANHQFQTKNKSNY